jgi:hypothetical protein
MKSVKFQVEGVEGDFFVDADALNDYKTMKALALADKRPSGLYEALEKIYMGKDEEYAERVGGMNNLEKLNNAAAEAAQAKN